MPKPPMRRLPGMAASLYLAVLLLIAAPFTPARAAGQDATPNNKTSDNAPTTLQCSHPVAERDIPALFLRLASKQLKLEFGDAHATLSDLTRHRVDGDLERISAYARYHLPGRSDLTTRYITGWLSRCTGTLVMRGNTWLADGTLSVPRYALADLPGRGLSLGRKDAPVQVIAYVDSRCPNCHRLIAYAKPAIASGRLHLELRQIAFLETPEQAIDDTQLTDTRFAQPPGSAAGKKPAVSDSAYLDMLSGIPDGTPVDTHTAAYRRALALIETNTHTARHLLHFTVTPGVLVREPAHGGRYRIVGYWEMNRLFQPDL